LNGIVVNSPIVDLSMTTAFRFASLNERSVYSVEPAGDVSNPKSCFFWKPLLNGGTILRSVNRFGGRVGPERAAVNQLTSMIS
jgi:hypothetical protein